jgi:hypothetical protein
MLADLLPAAAEAVLSYALARLDPADRVREWLKRASATLAYQQALAALAPLVVHLGGREAIAETFRAVRDVTRWWP